MLPNYKDGSIVNVVSSIMKSFGVKTPYGECKLLKNKDIKKYKHVVLMCLDGFGYDLIKMHCKSVIKENSLGKITTVFPSTTTAALTSFATGLAPKQHALVAWNLYIKEFGTIFKPLHFVPRMEGVLNIDGIKWFDFKSTTSKIKNSFSVIPADLINSPYTYKSIKGTKCAPYETLVEGFNKLLAIISKDTKSFTYFYWPGVDSLSHAYGKENGKVKKHIGEIENLFHLLQQNMKDTCIIVTSDHGQITSSPSELINLNKIPGFMDCLTMPISGEPRAAFCYVRPSKVKQFKIIYSKYLKKFCSLVSYETLIKKNYFGIGKEHKELFSRVGDYVLIAKKNYILKDYLFNEKAKFKLKGNHGGTSKEEMEVPLIFITNK